MSWIRHRRPNFSPIFPHFPRFSTVNPRQNPAQAPAHVICTWHPCASSHATLQDPAIITWLMRHQPALITCLHSRPCFWTLGPRPLSIVPTISVPFRYRTILVNSPIGPRTHLASPLLSPHCFLCDPQLVFSLSRYGRSIILTNPHCSPSEQ